MAGNKLEGHVTKKKKNHNDRGLCTNQDPFLWTEIKSAKHCCTSITISLYLMSCFL